MMKSDCKICHISCSVIAIWCFVSSFCIAQLPPSSIKSDSRSRPGHPELEKLTIQSPGTARPPLEDKYSSQFDFQVVPAPPGFEEWTSPVILPAPAQKGTSPWSKHIPRAQQFVAQLTLEEKVNLTTGAGIQGRCVGETGTVPRLGFNQPICLQDGPVGVRFTDFNSVFPAAINVAATFDRQLMFQRAKSMGEEAKNKGVNVLLAPMTNLMRTPEAGRSWEGFGADPYLSGVATVQSVLGIQSTRASACVKHYIGNEQEHFRGGSGSNTSSSNVDDRTLRELYDWPFAEAIHAGVDYMMCSYNRINQTYACENSKLINGIAKGEQGFQGVLVTDWAAAASGVRTTLAGTDMNMPGFMAYGQPSEANPSTANSSYWGLRMIEAVKNGSVPISRLDDMVTRVMSTYYKQGQDQADYPRLNFISIGQGTPAEQAALNRHVNVQKDHHLTIREVATHSIILLKNLNHTLPLKSPNQMKSVVVIGSDAGDNPQGPNSCADRGCIRGILATGWGSGTANFPYLTAPATAIQNYLSRFNPSITYRSIFDDYAYNEIGNVSTGVDVAIVHVSSDSGEGYITVDGNKGDRNNISLWNNGDDLILKAAGACNNVVVVVHAVGPVDMEAWIEHPNVTAVLWAGLPGQEAGSAEVNILWGLANPSARLPYTIAKKRSDYPAQLLYDSNATVPQITYDERLNIDYRHFDAQKIEPRFEFGFGLSYTTFTWDSLAVTNSLQSQKSTSASSPNCRELSVPTYLDPYQNILKFAFKLTNSGAVDGHEVVQLYVGFPAQVQEPPKVLRGFERVYLVKKTAKTVVIDLRVKDVSVWDVSTQSWQIPAGTFTFMLGASSRQIQLTHQVEIKHTQ